MYGYAMSYQLSDDLDDDNVYYDYQNYGQTCPHCGTAMVAVSMAGEMVDVCTNCDYRV